MDIPGYETLRYALELAYAQSATGKGKERHANDKPFDRQPIMEIARMVGVGGHTFQICKKAQEATTMAARGEHEKAITELCGAMVYAAAAVTYLNEQIVQIKHAQSKTLGGGIRVSTAAVDRAVEEAIKEMGNM